MVCAQQRPFLQTAVVRSSRVERVYHAGSSVFVPVSTKKYCSLGAHPKDSQRGAQQTRWSA